MGCGRGWSDAKSKTEHAQQRTTKWSAETSLLLVFLPLCRFSFSLFSRTRRGLGRTHLTQAAKVANSAVELVSCVIPRPLRPSLEHAACAS